MERRSFPSCAAAGGVLALAPPALAKPAALTGEAVRAGEAMRLSWDAKGQPVSVLVSQDPDAPRRAMRPLKAAATGGRAEVAAPVAPRPYYLLVAKDGRQARVAERLLPLQGGRNFRDLGGYRSADGRQVRWGRIYRSGVMAGLTADDMAYLGKLGVKVICDLRSPQERRDEPSPFLKTHAAEVVAFDYDMNSSMAQLVTAKTRDQAVDVFAAAYVNFLDMLTPHYTAMFDRLAAGDAPLAMNCSAGKDRTGMGSALVLSALGVPRETVVADYALTQVYSPPAVYRRQMAEAATAPSPTTTTGGLTPQMAQAFARMPPEVLDVIMGSDPAVMRKALAEVDRRHGGPVKLVQAKFGVTDAKLARLHSLYLA